jgi:hypothetical protein
MKNSTVNIDNGLSAIGKDKNAPIGESFALWNDPAWCGYSRETRVVENLNSWRTHYPIESRRDNLLNRILRKIGLH